MIAANIVNVPSVGNLLAGVAGVAVALLVIGVLVVLIVANRAEPDPRGMRPFSVYLFATSFVALFVTLVGTIVIVSSVVQLIGSHPYSIRNQVARDCVVGGIVTLLGAATLGYHLRRGTQIAKGDGRPDGPSARVLHTYVSAVIFVSVPIIVIGLGIAAYLVFVLAGPGVFGGGGGRTATARHMIDTLYVVLAAAVIIAVHLKWGPPELSPGLRRASSVTAAPPPSAPVVG